MSQGAHIRLGTRGSALARWQAEWVAAQLAGRGVKVEPVVIATHGDRQGAGPIGQLGTTGVFTKAIQDALLDERIDLAVHSLKDLPTEPVDGLVLAAVPPRERSGDALISRDGLALADLPAGSVVGTGSLRRQAQLLHVRPDLHMKDIRGNVETRLAKLVAVDTQGDRYHALVLAEAGLLRLGLADRITQVLPREIMLPAVGQGALGLETRADDPRTQKVVHDLDDAKTHRVVLAERSMLAALRGGCLAPVGAWGRVDDRGILRLEAAVFSRDGSQRIDAALEGDAADAVELGHRVADHLLQQGADDLIRASRDIVS